MPKKIKYFLHDAVKQGNLKKAKKLLEQGANPNRYDEEGETPLIYAVFKGNLNMVLLLLKYKARPNQYENNIALRTPLLCAIRVNHVKIANALLKHRADPNKMDYGRDGFLTPIEYAILYANESMFHLLMKHKARITGREILLAAKNGKYGILKFLMQKGANPNKKDELGYTVLHNAIEGGSPLAIKLLIKSRANPKSMDKQGLMPLHYAVMRKKRSMIEALLKNKVEPNLKGKEGFTPLHLAVWQNDIVAAKILLKYGADPNIEDEKGLSPADYCVRSNNCKMRMMLLKQGGIGLPHHIKLQGRLFEMVFSAIKDGLKNNLNWLKGQRSRADARSCCKKT